MRKIFYVTIVLVITLIGCSSDEDNTLPNSNFPEDHVIRVTTDINNRITARAGYDSDNLTSFGLILQNSTNEAYSYNKEMIKSEGEWATGDGSVMLWDKDRTLISVTAYAPYIATELNTTLTVDAKTDQNIEANLMASDFLLMKKVVNPETDLTSDGKIDIALNHAMSKLIVKITINGSDNLDMSKLIDMSIEGTIVNGVCDLSEADPKVIPTTDATATSVVPYKNVNSCECILLPQTITQGFSINFIYDGRRYIWNATEDIVLQKGMEQTLTLNISTTKTLQAAMQTRDRATGQIVELRKQN